MAVQAQQHSVNTLENKLVSQSVDISGVTPRAFFYMPFTGLNDAQQIVQGSQSVIHPVSAAQVAATSVVPNFNPFHQAANTIPLTITTGPSRNRLKESPANRAPQLLLNQPQAPVAMQFVDLNQAQGVAPQSAVVSTGLRLAFDDEHSTVTSARPETRSAGTHMILSHELYAQVMRQQEDFSLFLKHQTDQFRQVMEEQMQSHSKAILAIVEEEAARQLRDKEMEIQRITRRNMELEEQVRQLGLEAEMWQNKAKNNEAMVAVLRSNLQQAVVQSREHTRMEGCGDSEADDAASAHIDENAGRAALMKTRAVQENMHARACKKCMIKEVSILLVPCFHLCLCNDCKGVENCPVCGAITTACVEVYLA